MSNINQYMRKPTTTIAINTKNELERERERKLELTEKKGGWEGKRMSTAILELALKIKFLVREVNFCFFLSKSGRNLAKPMENKQRLFQFSPARGEGRRVVFLIPSSKHWTYRVVLFPRCIIPLHKITTFFFFFFKKKCRCLVF